MPSLMHGLVVGKRLHPCVPNRFLSGWKSFIETAIWISSLTSTRLIQVRENIVDCECLFVFKKLTCRLNTAVIHAWAKSGGKEAAVKAQQLLTNMRRMHQEGNSMSQPDTITVRSSMPIRHYKLRPFLFLNSRILSLSLVQCCHQCMGEKW